MTPLLFWHIPKTGGTTVLSACQEALGGFAVYRKSASKEALEKLLGQHVFVQTGSVFAQCSVDHMDATLVRDPVERAVSLYYHVVGDTRRALHREARRRGLLGFVSMDNPEMSNWQVRHLSGCGHAALTERDLSIATDRVKSFSVVGVTDNMDTFLAKLGAAMHVGLVTKRERYHSRPRGEAIEQRVRDTIAHRNEMDYRLYEEVCEFSSPS